VALTTIGARQGDVRTVVIGGGFSLMAALLAVHGLATPGVILGTNGLIAISGGITLPVGGAVLAFCALPRFAPATAIPRVVALLATSLYAALVLTFMDLGWWLGHVFEVIGIAVVGASVAYDLHRGRGSRPLVGDLRASEIVVAEEAFLGARVRALMVRLAEKD